MLKKRLYYLLRFLMAFSLLSLSTYSIANGRCSLVQFEDRTVSFTTPTSDFVLNNDGTAFHKRTGRMWKRCTSSQTWNGTTCIGTADGGNWSNAIAAEIISNSGWRVPTVKELYSIVEMRCMPLGINSEVFPGELNTLYWSSTPTTSGVQAYVVDFSRGSVVSVDRYVSPLSGRPVLRPSIRLVKDYSGQ